MEHGNGGEDGGGAGELLSSIVEIEIAKIYLDDRGGRWGGGGGNCVFHFPFSASGF